VPFNFESKRIETAEELQQELDSNPPDIILSDFTLPQFDGLQALRILQKRKLDIPFILVTGTRSEEVAVDCIKEGADDYILKASLMRLRSSIDNTLRKKATER
jgi:DNA-binding NtrC family response regulator